MHIFCLPIQSFYYFLLHVPHKDTVFRQNLKSQAKKILTQRMDFFLLDRWQNCEWPVNINGNKTEKATFQLIFKFLFYQHIHVFYCPLDILVANLG